METSDYYKNKSILVTGGAGSIGSALVRKLLILNVKIIRIFDNNETALFDLGNELQSEKIRLLVGDIKDKERLKRAFEGIDVVFHAAALKHVPLCEYNPFDAVKTNILGTQNVLNVALDEEVEKVITISTDKAVNPSNVMGATKLLAERLTLSANYYKGARKTVLSCVRFGNVLGSRGSVVPVFHQQIKTGVPLTVTDPEMTRFIMTIPKAVDLILEAGKIAKHGEIFILKMPVIRIKDLAKVMIETLGQKYNYPFGYDQVKIIQKRPGEKLHEELMGEFESDYVFENDDMFIIYPNHLGFNEFSGIPGGFIKTETTHYSSRDGEFLSKSEIAEIINENYNEPSLV